MDALCSRPADLLAFSQKQLTSTESGQIAKHAVGFPGNRWKQANFRINLVPSGKLSHNYGKSPFLVGKYTISTGPFSMSQTVNVDQAGAILPGAESSIESENPRDLVCLSLQERAKRGDPSLVL